MMNKILRGLKVAAALVSLLTAGMIVDMSTPGGLRAAVVAMCNCGRPECRGCLKGRLLPGGVSETAPPAGCGCNAPAEVIYAQPSYAQPAPAHATTDVSCGCNSGCNTCQKPVASPQCDCQFCELEVKKGEVEKTSFKTEQKEVCIPAVRLPWKKNCPPKRSKVRTVNVLKKHKYKTPKCEYKWKVKEPADFDQPTEAQPMPTATAEATAPNSVGGSDSKFPDPNEAFEAVPRPPLEN